MIEHITSRQPCRSSESAEGTGDSRLNFSSLFLTVLRWSVLTSLYFLGLFSKPLSLSFHALPVFSLKIFSNSASAVSALANGVFWNCPPCCPMRPQLVNRIQMSLCFSFHICHITCVVIIWVPLHIMSCTIFLQGDPFAQIVGLG